MNMYILKHSRKSISKACVMETVKYNKGTNIFLFISTKQLFDMTQYKARILVIGPSKSGKSKIVNFLADVDIVLPDSLRPTKGLRILEYDITNLDLNGWKVDVDVQLWDASGDDKYSSYWPVFRNNIDGVVFVYSQEDDLGVRKLDLMYNYFVTQSNLSPRACLVCAVYSDDPNAKLSSTFSKVSQISVNLSSQGEKFRNDFTKYIASVVNTIANKNDTAAS